jgi:DNA polymerase-3 subunit gamma/tau
MSYQVLARKWRPKTFQELVGQESVVQALVNGLEHDRVHHAFLFTGTRGVGKTTLARILAKCLNCEQGVSANPCGECSACVDIDEGRFQDMLEIDAASRTGVDDTRELLESVQFAPARGRYKVYIIDEVHMLSTASFNALLKTLEEPPPHVKFVLATTDPQKIPVTILSRCLRFNLRRLLPEQIVAHLDDLLAAESVEAEASAVERIARAADGSMRDALSLLDQAIAFGGGRLEDGDVAQMMGSVDHEHVAVLLRALAAGDAGKLLEVVRELAAQARNLETVLLDLAEVLHRIGLVQLVPGYTDPERSDWASVQELSGLITPEDVQLYYQIAVQGRRDLGLAPDPRTGLEMALLRMLAFRPATAPGGESGGAGEEGVNTAAPRARRAAGVSAAPAEEPRERNGAGSGQGKRTVRRDAAGLAWDELMPTLGLEGAVRELARNIQLESRKGDRWRFLIPEEASHLGNRKLVQQLQSALSSQLGETIQVAIDRAAQPIMTPATVSEQAELRQRSDAEQAIEDDPTVRALKERFGARILEDSIQPIQ